MKVICYNIQACAGVNDSYLNMWKYFVRDPGVLNRISGKLASSCPDVIGLVETDTGAFNNINQPAQIAKSLGQKHVSACKYGWASSWPIFKNLHSAILTKHKILQVKKHNLAAGFKRLALEVIMQVDSEKISVLLTHLSITSGTRKKQLAELSNVIKKIKNKLIVLGDFNQENVRLPGLKSCCPGKTFPSWKPKKQFDYIFAGRDTKVKDAAVLDWKISDHLPVYAEIEV